MKYRIVEDAGMYYPQIKGWFGWNYIEDDYWSFVVSYKRLEDAILFIETLKSGKNSKNNTKVVWCSE